MRGQVLLSIAVVIIITTLLLLAALPKRTLGPYPHIEDQALQRREVEHMLRAAFEESLKNTALRLSYNPSASLEQLLRQEFNATWNSKVLLYYALRGVWCQLKDKPRIEIFNDGVIEYVKSIYAEVVCENGIYVSMYSTAELEVESKLIGAFGAYKIKTWLYYNGQPTHIISYGAVLVNETCGENCWVPYPLLGSLDESERMWLFNITQPQEVRIAIPTEFAMMKSYYILFIATTPGHGVGTVAVIKGEQFIK